MVTRNIYQNTRAELVKKLLRLSDRRELKDVTRVPTVVDKTVKNRNASWSAEAAVRVSDIEGAA